MTLAAVVDSTLTRAGALATAWGWERLESDWRRVVNATDIDVVDICVPNILHAEIAAEALANGKHVICEKPLAHDVGSAQSMVQAAAASGRVAQVCFYYRLWPAVSEAKRLVLDRALGRITHFRGWMLQDYARAGHDLGWRRSHAQSGGGALSDLGSHIIDISRYLCGDIARVSAVTRSWGEPEAEPGVEDQASLLLEFGSGATGTIEAGWAMTGHKADLGFDLIGEHGAIRFTWERSNEVEILAADGSASGGLCRLLLGPGDGDADRFGGVKGQGLGYRDAFTIGLGRAITAIARGETDAGPTFEDGLRAAEVVAAAIEAAKSGTATVVDQHRSQGQ